MSVVQQCRAIITTTVAPNWDSQFIIHVYLYAGTKTFSNMYIGRSLQISGVSCDSTKLRFSDCGYTVHEQDYSFCDQHSGVICAIGRVRNIDVISEAFILLRADCLSYHVFCIKFHSHKGFQHNSMLLNISMSTSLTIRYSVDIQKLLMSGVQHQTL